MKPKLLFIITKLVYIRMTCLGRIQNYNYSMLGIGNAHDKIISLRKTNKKNPLFASFRSNSILICIHHIKIHKHAI
jgi:hypothetical protein